MARNPALLMVLVSAAVLLPSLAMAHGRGAGHRHPAQVAVVSHDHYAGCEHMPVRPPAGVPARTGNYELRPVSSWVPGHYEKQWVPEVCTTKHRGRRSKTVCRDGYYENVWVPAQQVVTQQWVWVPYERPAYRPRPVARRPGVSVQVSARL